MCGEEDETRPLFLLPPLSFPLLQQIMASFLSSVTTLVNPASQPTSSTPIHATFSGSYEKLEPSIKLLNQNGYPSEPLKKGKLPFTTSSKNIKVSIPTVAWRVTSMSSKTGKLKSSGAKSDPGETLFSSKEHEMIDIRKRSALGKVVEMLIGRRCQEPRFGFAMKAVSQEPNQAERDIVDGMISVGYQYSTAKVILKCQKSTDQELEMKFDEILNHLDRRGVLWDRAGRRIDTFEDSKNIQVEFLILGAFPKVSSLDKLEETP